MKHLRSAVLTGALAAAFGLSPAAANPLGGQVAGGTATVQGQGTSTVTVTQSTDRAIINWNTFNIGAGETTRFVQPGAASITLNRVTGGLGPSQIYGTLTANGRIFLVNPNGVLFGSGAVIDTSGFLATTSDIKNDDFMAGRNSFTIPGNPSASIVNMGTITARSGGIAALVAPGVRNSGTITADLGKVAMAAGNGFTLDFYGDKLITLQVGDQIASQVIDVQTQQPLSALVKNEGTLKASGGRVELTAAAARQVVDAVINNTGVIEADTVGTRNGMIVLGAATDTAAGAPAQAVKVSGTLSAAGRKAGETGGKIQITGQTIAVAGARIDASGRAGGGKVLIGGDVGGGRGNAAVSAIAQAALETTPVPTAASVSVDAATLIDVSARDIGNGGKLVVWSDSLTSFAGAFQARGGATGGDGGFAEISSKGRLSYNGFGDLQAPAGKFGTLLLDPADFYIVAGDTETPEGASVMTSQQIQTQLGKGNLVISTNNDSNPSDQHGDIFVNASVSWGSGDSPSSSSLTLSAYRNIDINEVATISNIGSGNLTLRADNTGRGLGTVANSGGTIDWRGSSGDVSIFYNPSTPITHVATKYQNPSDFVNVLTKDPSQLTAYMLVNTPYDLQTVNSNLGGTYALGRDIVATSEGPGANFNPIGGAGGQFTGLFDGLGHSISGLTIAPNDSTTNSIGLFGVIGVGGVVRDVSLTNVSVSAPSGAGLASIGTLAGTNLGTIVNASATGVLANAGSIEDDSSATFGGLVGVNGNSGIIRNSIANVAVTAKGPDTWGSIYVGGLVGQNAGTITSSSANGAVVGLYSASDGAAYIGGLVGWNRDSASIQSSYATGSVSGTGDYQYAGGLVGVNDGSISTSYANGNVSVSGYSNEAYIGGLVGWNRRWESNSSIEQSYATGNVTGNGDNGHAGGLVGMNEGSIAQSFALGDVNVTGMGSYAGGFVGANGVWSDGSLISESYSSGAVSASGEGSYKGGFAGTNVGTVEQSYWDSDIAGPNALGDNSNSSGMSGLTGAQARQQSSYAGWNFNADGGAWFMVDGQTRPFLRSEWSSTITNTHQLQLMTLDPSASYTLANDVSFGSSFNNPSDMWGPGGFVPIGSGGAFTGVFDGQGNTIGGLTIAPNDGRTNSIGLFATIGQGGSVHDLMLADVTVKANVGYAGDSQFVGALAGQNAGSIDNVAVISSDIRSTVDGLDNKGVSAGGLVGQNGMPGGSSGTAVVGQISRSFADVDVSVGAGNRCNGTDCSGQNFAGGLVGQNNGTIQGTPFSDNNPDYVPTTGTASELGATFALGDVKVGSQATGGGLVGQNNGAIQYAFAFGNVAGAAGASSTGDKPFDNTTRLGGLVGSNNGTIDSSAAVGDIGSADTPYLTAGGLVGDNSGRISNSFAIATVAAGDNSVVGGLAASNSANNSSSNCTGCFVGINNDATIIGSIGIGDVSAGSSSVAGGFVGYTNGAVGTSDGGTTGSFGGAFSGNVAAGSDSIVGGFAGVVDTQGQLDVATAYGQVSAGTNSIVGGFVGVNAGRISNAKYGLPDHVSQVSGGSESFVGGFAGQNFGSVTDFNVDPPVFGGDSGSVVGGVAGFNSGSLRQGNVAVVLPTGGTGFVGPVAGVNSGTWSEVTVNGQTIDFTGNFTGGSGTSLPTPPAWVPPCAADVCGLVTQVLLPSLPASTANPGQPPLTPNLFTPPPDLNNGTTINLTLTSPPGTPPSGGNPPGNSNGGNNPPPRTGPPPGPGIGRTLNEQLYSGVPPFGETRFLPSQVVVQISNMVSPERIQQLARQFGFTVIASQPLGGDRTIYTFKLPNGKDIRAVIRALERNQVVASAQPNYVFGLTQDVAPQPAPPAGGAAPDRTGSLPPPSEPGQSDLQSADVAARTTLPAGDAAQYIIDKLRLGAVHARALGRNVTIAVIDSEIDVQHPDLAGVVTQQFDATGTPSSPHPHGTGMAGAIAAKRRLLGVAPGVHILAVKAFDETATSAEATSYQLIKGLEWAVSRRVRIINMSFAGPRDLMMERLLQKAYDLGTVLIAAAGNAGPKSPPLYPAADVNVIAVSATDYNNKPFKMANRGRYIAVAAPGVDVLVPAPRGSYQLTTGTSVAAAHVSGVAALLLESRPTLTPGEVRAILMNTADLLGPKGRDDITGAGLVDPFRALTALTPRSADTGAATRTFH